MRLAPGWAPFVLPPLCIGSILLALAPRIAWLGALGGGVLLLAGAVALFFRDPDREITDGIVAAADGRIREVDPDGIVTFLNVHNVHVVRAPYAGRVTRVERHSGPRRPAFLPQAEDNAGATVEMDTAWGPQTVRLLAGLVARQVVTWVEPGQRVEKGERIGMIRFGSRVDVTLPPGSEPTVEPGQTAHAARTRLARPPAKGEGGPG